MGRERTDRFGVPTIKKLPFAGIAEERRESLTKRPFPVPIRLVESRRSFTYGPFLQMARQLPVRI